MVHCAAGISRVWLGLCSLPLWSSPTSCERTTGPSSKPSPQSGSKGPRSSPTLASNASSNNTKTTSISTHRVTSKPGWAPRPVKKGNTIVTIKRYCLKSSTWEGHSSNPKSSICSLLNLRLDSVSNVRADPTILANYKSSSRRLNSTERRG